MTWTRETELRIHPPDKPFCHRLPPCTQRLWPKFDKYLGARDLNHDLARKNLWFPSNQIDGYTRIVVPATSDQPGNLYWQARLAQAVTGEPEPRRWESPGGCARGNALCLVWPREAGPGRPTCIVEGPMDALAAAGEGFVAIALMGVVPPVSVLDLTSRLFRGTMPVMVMDLNAEEQMAANQAMLADRGLQTRLVSPYPGKDLAALDRAVRRKVLGR